MVQNTHNNHRLQSIDTMFSRIKRTIISNAPSCPCLLRARFLSVQASVRDTTNTQPQSDKTGVSDTLFNINTKLNAHHSSHVLQCLIFFLRIWPAQTRAPRRWGPPVARVSTSTCAPGSRFEPVMRCALRSSASTTPQPRWFSPGSTLHAHVPMRINGDLLDQDLLAAFAGQMRASVSASLSGDLPDHSWWQATPGVTRGGLGPSHGAWGRASRLRCQPHHMSPLVSTMVDHFSLAFGTPSQPIMAEYDAHTDAALARRVSTLSTNATHLLLGQLDEALAERELLWHNWGRRAGPALSTSQARSAHHS